MKTYLTYGFALALAGAVLTLLLYVLGFHSDPAKISAGQWIVVGVMILIGAACIALGIKARRAQTPADEEFGYGKALGAGVMIALFASLFGMVTNALYTQVINPGFADVVVQAQIQKWEEAGLSASQIEAAESMTRRMMNPAIQGAFAFFGGMFFNTLIALVVAAFLKRPAGALERELPPTLG